ncbi:hypothetical protein BDV12DRAFT_99384 [Aspergillus spectabilis]
MHGTCGILSQFLSLQPHLPIYTLPEKPPEDSGTRCFWSATWNGIFAYCSCLLLAGLSSNRIASCSPPLAPLDAGLLMTCSFQVPMRL